MGHTLSQQNSEMTHENGVGDKTSVHSSLLSQLNQTLQTAAEVAEKRVEVKFTHSTALYTAPSSTLSKVFAVHLNVINAN